MDVIIDETYMLSNLTDWKNKMNLPATGPSGIKAVDNGDVYAITGTEPFCALTAPILFELPQGGI